MITTLTTGQHRHRAVEHSIRLVGQNVRIALPRPITGMHAQPLAVATAYRNLGVLRPKDSPGAIEDIGQAVLEDRRLLEHARRTVEELDVAAFETFGHVQAKGSVEEHDREHGKNGHDWRH